jgi:WD40 repeat protein
MKNTIFTIVLFAVTCHEGLPAKPDERPALVYESHGLLHVVTAAGRQVHVVRANAKIGSFTISSNTEKVIFTPLSQKLYGGQLFLLQDSRKPQLLTRGPYYNKSRRPAEVYSDPDYAPDEKRVVFSIHSQPTGDLVEASGPFAVLDLRTKNVTVLPDTLHVPGEAWGTGFASSAFWSPDGRKILLNFEDGSSLTDPEGKRLEDLSPLMKGEDWTSSIGWLGPQCVVYVTGKDYLDARKHPARFLNLKTHDTGTLDTLLGLTPEQVTNLVAISGSIRVRRRGADMLVGSGADVWSIPSVDGQSRVRILPRPASETPESCR